MKRILVSISFILLLFTGCAQPPTPEEIAKADYGSYVSQQDAENIARKWFDKTLKDPYSAKFETISFYKGYITKPPIYGGGAIYGYVLKMNCLAKNSYGAYNGWQDYVFLFKNGSIHHIITLDRGSYRDVYGLFY